MNLRVKTKEAHSGSQYRISRKLLHNRISSTKLLILPQKYPSNENNYLLFDSILNKEYNLIHAWNGEEAIELYRKFQPHVIIMDINMPKMDGYEAAREIRKFSKTIPIIAVTAYSFSSDKEKVLENGFNGYVPKPVDVHILKEKLHSTIKQNIAAI